MPRSARACSKVHATVDLPLPLKPAVRRRHEIRMDARYKWLDGCQDCWGRAQQRCAVGQGKM